MFAICFALAIALHGEPFMQSATSVGPLAALGHDVQGPIALPYGQAFGTYDIGKGELLALLEDASGMPLWLLDAEVYEDGGIGGDLLPLLYSTNPAVPGGMLSVSGQMLLDDDGNGRFYATVFQFGGGGPAMIPVFPVAKIEGTVKQVALGHRQPMSSGLSGLIAAASNLDGAGPQTLRSGVIVCPGGFPQPQGIAIESVRKSAHGGFAKNSSGARLIVDPTVARSAGSGHELPLAPDLARIQLRWWLLK